MDLEHADWIIDPGLEDYENLIRIDGWYENGDDEFYYEIYLRPWGTVWDTWTKTRGLTFTAAGIAADRGGQVHARMLSVQMHRRTAAMQARRLARALLAAPVS